MRIDAKTQLFGIIGHPLAHTFSPAMHNAAFAAKGINAVYLAFSTATLKGFKTAMNTWNLRGLSVTIPHKINVQKHLDRIEPLAQQIGAVNTIYRDSQNLCIGTNTDGRGAVRALEESGISLSEKKIIILGAGGAARSIAISLMDCGISSLTLSGRNRAGMNAIKTRCQKVGESIPIKIHETSLLKGPTLDIAAFDVVIQTTPLGMQGSGFENEIPHGAQGLLKNQIVFDIVYNPTETPFLRIAKKRGCHTVLGYKMLLYQGTQQFELFTNLEAPIKAMEKALLTAMRAKVK